MTSVYALTGPDGRDSLWLRVRSPPSSPGTPMAAIDRSATIRKNPAMAKRHTVATIIPPDSNPFEWAVTAEVFGVDRSSQLGVDWYEWKACTVDDQPIATAGGLTLAASYGLEDAATADTVIVTPSDSRQYSEELLATLREAHSNGARIVSLCSGVFALAAAGLVADRQVTTHWAHASEFAQEFESVAVDCCVLYVDDGDILTSAGTAAGIDLCLHIVRLDHGVEIANQVARRMVVPPHRDGGQAQYVDHPIDELPGHELFADTLAWAERHLAEEITVEQLAERSAMSPRTFARRFTSTTGTTPHQWLTSLRIQYAQQLLESTDHPIDRIAELCGLGSGANLRQHFQRTVRTTPSNYRNTFQVVCEA